MAYQFDSGIFSIEGLAGEILPGTTIGWYVSGTSTPLATYSDEDLTVPNANPIVIEADGRLPTIWLQAQDYKMVVTLPDGTVLTRDPVFNPSDRLATLLSGSGGVLLVNGATGYVASRALLAAIAPTTGMVQILTESGREGSFIWRLGDYAARVSADTLQGIYIASSTIASSVGAWVRDWDGKNCYADWFGAKLDDGAFDSGPAMQAALDVTGILTFPKGFYYSNQGLVLPERCVVTGCGENVSGFFVNHATDHLLSADGVAATSYIDTVTCRDFGVARSVNPTTPASGADDKTQGHGIHCHMVSNPIFENVYTYNNLVECYISNVLTGRFDGLRGFRTLGSGVDRHYGVWINGEDDDQITPGQYPSPNPSLKVSNCNMVSAFAALQAYSLYGNGSLTDSWVESFESATAHKGMFYDLTGVSSVGANDVRVINAVFDGYKTNGVHIKGAPLGANILIDNPQPTGSAAATDAGIWIEAAHGVRVVNIEAIGTNKPSLIGCNVTDSSRVTIAGDFIDYNIAFQATSAPGGEFRINAVKNAGVAVSDEAVRIITCSRTKVEARLNGVAVPSWVTGLAVDNTSANCALDVTGIMDGVCTNRYANNGTPVTTQGNVGGHSVINPGTGAML